MSTEQQTTDTDDEQTPLDELCESIANNDEHDEDIRALADHLHDAIKRGDVDVT